MYILNLAHDELGGPWGCGVSRVQSKAGKRLWGYTVRHCTLYFRTVVFCRRLRTSFNFKSQAQVVIRFVCLERLIFVFNWGTKNKVLCLDISVLKDTESREEQDDVASYLQWVANTECWNHFVIRAYQVQQKALHGGTESTLFAQNKTKTVACLAKWLAVHNTLPVLKT